METNATLFRCGRVVMAQLKFLRKIGIGVFSRGWSQVTAMAMAIVAARLLGKADFGVYSVASIFIIILQAMMYGGIYDYIIKSQSDDLEPNTCFWLSLSFSVLGALLIALAAPWMGYIMHAELVTSLMLALAPSAVIAAAATWQEALLLRQGRLTLYYSVAVGTETLACLLGIASLLSGCGLWSYVIYRYAQTTFYALAYFLAQRRLPKFRWCNRTAAAAFKFSYKIYISQIVGSVSNYSSDLLIGTLVSPASAGAYRLANRIAVGLSEVAYQPFGTMAWVHFSKAVGDRSAMGREWISFVTILSVTVWPTLAFCALMSRSILAIIVGSGWGEAVVVLILLSIARMALMVNVFLEPMLGVLDHTGLILKVRMLTSFGIVLCLFCLARYGAFGAAVAQLIMALVIACAAAWICVHEMRLSARELFTALTPGVIVTSGTLLAVESTEFLPLGSAPLLIHALIAGVAALMGWSASLALLVRHNSALRKI